MLTNKQLDKIKAEWVALSSFIMVQKKHPDPAKRGYIPALESLYTQLRIAHGDYRKSFNRYNKIKLRDKKEQSRRMWLVLRDKDELGPIIKELETLTMVIHSLQERIASHKRMVLSGKTAAHIWWTT